ncbi:hypothetical protein BC477_12035 [Clavibacter michiganensis subsp. michiganensis]|uniref:Uncharacterized protein n=1 Tax=Clavibacter michiganensis subsp. michiganensis TaxID=33013 RepID=A0A251XHG4_CLAMM|nr:hypothetical protein BC477_12035 [Clavibacter michiganensis subsp. michiganensis]OUE02525.1 hypothetical protein CMMCAS07_10945 [Clavibacter michiganensis subsp. michiganensis]
MQDAQGPVGAVDLRGARATGGEAGGELGADPAGGVGADGRVGLGVGGPGDPRAGGRPLQHERERCGAAGAGVLERGAHGVGHGRPRIARGATSTTTTPIRPPHVRPTWNASSSLTRRT